MSETARTPSVAGFTLFTLLLTAVFVALGVWQLQRRTAKHELIAALTERLAAAPVALPPPAQWAALTPARDEFRRVTFTATFAASPDAMDRPNFWSSVPVVTARCTWASTPGVTRTRTFCRRPACAASAASCSASPAESTTTRPTP